MLSTIDPAPVAVNGATRFTALLDAKAHREAARAVTLAARAVTSPSVRTARREELGRLLDMVAAHSTGGYVLVRSGLVHHSRQQWRVNIRHAGREYTHTGRELGGALYRAAYRLCYQRRPKEDGGSAVTCDTQLPHTDSEGQDNSA